MNFAQLSSDFAYNAALTVESVFTVSSTQFFSITWKQCDAHIDK